MMTKDIYNMNKRDMLAHVGSMEQVAYARRMTIDEGGGKGITVVQVKCGDLDYVVLLDRGIDIANVNYKGIPISYISKTGLKSPYTFDSRGTEFLRSFTGGLLTTCGMTYFGAPCKDQGEALGLHGRMTGLIGSDIGISCEFEEDDYVIRIKGKVRESAVFGENVVLRREIISVLGENRIIIKDEVENEGFTQTPLMLLYHCNFGYPMLSGATILEYESNKTIPRDDIATMGLSDSKVFESPKKVYKEQVFFHQLQGSDYHFAHVNLINPEIGIGMTLHYDTSNLPYMVEWKQMGQGDYVLGLEPATWVTYGRAKAREMNQLKMIEPGELLTFSLDFSFESL